MYCHISNQISAHAHRMGLDQMEEIEQEKRMLDSLKMGNKYLQVLGRRHCRHGFKPAIEQKEYLNGYSSQYVRENSF